MKTVELPRVTMLTRIEPDATGSRIHAITALLKQLRDARSYAAVLSSATEARDLGKALGALARAYAALRGADAVGATLAMRSQSDGADANLLLHHAFADCMTAIGRARAVFGEDVNEALRNIAETSWS